MLMYLLLRQNDGWMAQWERRFLQNTHQTNREMVKAKTSLKPKKKGYGSPPLTAPPQKNDVVTNHLTHEAGEHGGKTFRLGFK